MKILTLSTSLYVIISLIAAATVSNPGTLFAQTLDTDDDTTEEEELITEVPTEEPEVPTEEEQPLTASATWDSTNGDTAPATFLFETYPEGGTEPYTFSWDFGDGRWYTPTDVGFGSIDNGETDQPVDNGETDQPDSNP